jgi:hypothetical protein
MDRPGHKPHIARALFTFVTLTAYVPILTTLLGFTWIALLHINDDPTRYSAWAVYGAAEVIEVWAISRCLAGSKFTYKGPRAGLHDPIGARQSHRLYEPHTQAIQSNLTAPDYPSRFGLMCLPPRWPAVLRKLFRKLNRWRGDS